MDSGKDLARIQGLGKDLVRIQDLRKDLVYGWELTLVKAEEPL
jgi:hypothetical protein